ncbi:MAG TPA: hypothetical protein VN922_04700 [Bacteroidia bacterium]|nr:hypothetical protein [Bacteroidia bacterium]
MSEEDDKTLDRLWSDFTYGNTKFDEQSLYISSGALAISLSFIKDIVPLKDSCCIHLFYIAIILFLTTIICSYLGHRLSSRIIYKSYKMTLSIKDTEDVDMKLKLENERYTYVEDKTKLIESVNKVISTSLVTGLITLVLYCILNIAVYRNGSSNQSKEKCIVNSVK